MQSWREGSQNRAAWAAQHGECGIADTSLLSSTLWAYLQRVSLNHLLPMVSESHPPPPSHKNFWRIQQPASTNRKSEIKLGQWIRLCWVFFKRWSLTPAHTLRMGH